MYAVRLRSLLYLPSRKLNENNHGSMYVACISTFLTLSSRICDSFFRFFQDFYGVGRDTGHRSNDQARSWIPCCGRHQEFTSSRHVSPFRASVQHVNLLCVVLAFRLLLFVLLLVLAQLPRQELLEFLVLKFLLRLYELRFVPDWGMRD